jgi:hypothetical protein
MKIPSFTEINFSSFVKKSCFLYSLFIFSYHSLYILLRSIILFICRNKLSIFLMAMNTFFKSYAETDLAWLHYITFIEPIIVSPNETLSFDSELFTNTSINKFIEAKTKEHFLLFEEHFFTSVLVHRKSYDVQFDDLLNENLEFFSEP